MKAKSLALVLCGILGTLCCVPLVTDAEVIVEESVIGGGAGTLSDAAYVLAGTLCQTTVGVIAGPEHSLSSGYWPEAIWLLQDVDTPPDDRLLRFSFGRGRPNPFREVTALQLTVPKPCQVTLKLYDVCGRETRTLMDRRLDSGVHDIVLDARGLSSGVYFCRIVAEGFTRSRRLVLLK